MPDTAPPNPDEARLTRIEESLGFAQRDLDELSAQVRGLHESLALIAKRLDRLEHRLAPTDDPDDTADPTTP